ncbi:head maturation protease, ClpP-related [Latilactobacillus curvatus]|uniref:head maturation protease, ClpP-related n=1 Tax=Latilactobacillus curvatus TaxID=28038 RepID=UPI000DAAF4F7|nr:head maturation protease, ClpP-related [Latilactobacillus curvatus]AWV72542.1 Clp protease ClpP [Latilactobacillus curvatus]
MTKVIPIKGDIVTNMYGDFYDYFGIDYASPKQVTKAINEAAGDELDVQINSGGGIVDAGSEIYTALMSYSGNVTVSVVGMAASAASLIAMAGDVVQMSPSATMMIHNVSSGAQGDYRDMANAADMLKKANDSIANAYELKTGMEHNKILDLMNQTYWLSPKDAVDMGFADKMMFEEEPNALLTASINGIPSLEQLQKFNESKKSIPKKQELAFLMAKNKLLSLGGQNIE